MKRVSAVQDLEALGVLISPLAQPAIKGHDRVVQINMTRNHLLAAERPAYYWLVNAQWRRKVQG